VTRAVLEQANPTFRPSGGSYEVTVESDDTLVRLARRVVAGDRAALDELLRELEPLVVRTARLIVGSGSWAAEDAAQEALLDIARGARALRAPEAVRTWALRVTTTRAIKVGRRERYLRLRAPAAAAELAAEPEDERAEALKAAFDRLPPRLRATAVLRLYVGLSEVETAEVLGCSLGTVKSNLHDARKRLAASLGESGFAPASTSLEETADAC
jgi:RNA polymerase sigma factor (sigma-70 family)